MLGGQGIGDGGGGCILMDKAPPTAILATYDGGVRFSGMALGAFSCIALYRGPAACPGKPGPDRLNSALCDAVISRLAIKHSRRRWSRFPPLHTSLESGTGRTVGGNRVFRRSVEADNIDLKLGQVPAGTDPGPVKGGVGSLWRLPTPKSSHKNPAPTTSI